MNQNRFRSAVAYWRSIRIDPDTCAPYKTVARIHRKRACDLADADFIQAPAICGVNVATYTGKAAQTIEIGVTDDFEVAGVEVLIRCLDGATVEGGAAAAHATEPNRWVYVTQANIESGQTVVIEIMAADRAGNTVVKQVEHALIS